MFKGRLRIWIATLISFCVIQCLITFAPTWFKSNNMTINVEVAADADMDEPLGNKQINGYKLRLQNSDSDVIITDEDLTITGYTKYEDYLQSPLVLYTRNLSNYNSGFIRVDTKNSYCYKIDLLSVLQAMENSSNWEDLRVNSKIVSGAVALYIPNDQCAYYNQVVELFYLTLNHGKAPTEEERVALQNRVSTIVSKCHKVSDMKQAIRDEYEAPTKEHKVFIAPEYLYQRDSLCMGIDGSGTFMPVYFLNTVYLTADIYVKSGAGEEENVGVGFANMIQARRRFMSCTGWRVKNHTFDLDSISTVYMNTP